LLLPQLGMVIFDCRQTAVDLRDSRIRLDFRKRPVEMCTIDLTLEVGAIAPSWEDSGISLAYLCPDALHVLVSELTYHRIPSEE